MRRVLGSICALALAAFPALADPHGEQTKPDSAAAQEEHHAAAGAPSAAGQAMLEDVAADMKRTSGKLIALAEAIPADKYGWKPNPEVRSVSEVFIHVVGTNLLLPSALGAAPPEGLEMSGSPFETMARWEAEITSKDEVVAKLKESFEYSIDAVNSLDSAALDQKLELFGPPSSKRSYVFILMNHAHEHLGQSIAYARSLGITPPWSQRQEDAE